MLIECHDTSYSRPKKPIRIRVISLIRTTKTVSQVMAMQQTLGSVD